MLTERHAVFVKKAKLEVFYISGETFAHRALQRFGYRDRTEKVHDLLSDVIICSAVFCHDIEIGYMLLIFKDIEPFISSIRVRPMRAMLSP